MFERGKIMATVELKSISQLFGLDFYIPSYQRGYRWLDIQVRELLEDLYDFANSKREDTDYYCLQPIIVKKRDTVWELVDGQQRLTALWLIYALYYCSNREDVVNLKRNSYTLEYEEKPDFTRIFDEIDAFVEEGSLKQISKKFEEVKTRNIDSLNLIRSMDFISSFSINNKTAKGVLAKIYEMNDDIKIIWYVLDENEDPIQTFTNINANKIELTNSELIKAVLLHATLDENQMQNMALQWEDIEKGLNNNSFWNFIVNKKRNSYSTRIDYLFEIWCAKNDAIIQSNDTDRYAIFRIINNKWLSGKKTEIIWKEIQEIYETLMDWYNDYFYYHTIGMLFIINEKEKDVDIVKELYNIYAESDKQTFKKEILKRIRDLYFSHSNSTPFDNYDLDDIKNDLADVTSQNSEQVKNILLLYNIAMLINANNTYERFPFELYKNETWDIEHINPQTPKEASAEEKQAWMNSYLNIISDVKLKKEIQACIDNKLRDFDDVAKKVTDALEVYDNNSISNLVLLDSSTNRGYKNACFLEKRKKIIEVERKKNNDEKYIPIGTKWVFLKGYENANQLSVWGGIDMRDYSDDIANNVYSMLGGE